MRTNLDANLSTNRARLMTVGELSHRTGVPIKTLRADTDTGLVYPAGGSPANYRLYESRRIRASSAGIRSSPHWPRPVPPAAPSDRNPTVGRLAAGWGPPSAAPRPDPASGHEVERSIAGDEQGGAPIEAW
ncbi:MAG: MerR family DNA-binding transcriptional regulator [Sporichthyaceae bacterium]|nr:MerR family DNA-binding transcriptional regulator [Sporichthyaceae bacterium]